MKLKLSGAQTLRPGQRISIAGLRHVSGDEWDTNCAPGQETVLRIAGFVAEDGTIEADPVKPLRGFMPYRPRAHSNGPNRVRWN